MSERDQRRLELMKRRLFLFEREEIGLSTLVSDLDSLLGSFESADPKWKSAVREEWSTLGEVYAVSLDRGTRQISDASDRVVDRAIENLMQLVADVEGADR